MFADVIIDITLQKLDHTFQYSIPHELEEKIIPGVRVLVPFGKSKREGIVLSLSEEPKIEINMIKPILGASGNAPGSDLIQLALWMADYFGATRNQAIRTVIPRRKAAKPKESISAILKDETVARAYLGKLLRKKNHSIKKEDFIKAIIKEKTLDGTFIKNTFNLSKTDLGKFESEGVIELRSKRVFRGTFHRQINEEVKYELNNYQKHAVEYIRKSFANGDHRPVLIHGVTGSGKTEIYLNLIEDALEKDKDVIVLIPEIALTYQTLMRFYRRFGDLVSNINSRMSDGERQDQLDRAKNRDIRIMIGPRSALFTPFSHLGLIIIDEEHERSYKSQNAPRYHAVPTAIKRAKINGADLIMGSATPSIETYYKALNGQYNLVRLPERVMSRSLPRVELIDLREELKKGNRSMFSERLMELITDRLNKREQIMLFLNRRGISGAVLCRSCGEVIKCKHCSVSMSLHRDGMLHCHYCGAVEPLPRVCPSCGSDLIGTMKAGTESVESALNKLFPGASILRMDADTTRNKGSYEKILEKFHRHEADILIGTQMIVKGHDFPDVTLMGVLAADLSLNDSDFRAGENTFDLLVQAAGRAGRGLKPGNVIIQTYQPDNYVIRASGRQDYEGFYKDEIVFRKYGGYPPFGHMLKIQIEGNREDNVKEEAERCRALLNKLPPDKGKLLILGPSEAYPYKLNDYWRKTIYLKSPYYDRLIRIKQFFAEALSKTNILDRVNVWFDYDS